MEYSTKKLLEIDLTSREVHVEKIHRNVIREYIGGTGIGAKMLMEQTGDDTDPLGADNCLIFAVGPFTGTRVPSSGRHSVVAKSPLTGIWGESDIGGHWGTAFAKAGYLALNIKGCADESVYIYIEDDKVEIRSANHLWGKDTYEADELLKKACDKKVQIASIGPAGEKKVPMAAIMHDGKHGRAAGRSGLGAVMGSKNLKAVVVHGTQSPYVARPERLKDKLKRVRKNVTKSLAGLGEHGTGGGLMGLESSGDLPIQNFKKSAWENTAKLTGEIISEKYLNKRFACGACSIGCGRNITIDKGKYAGVDGAGPEYETMGSLGTYCLIDDLEAVCMGNELCNRYGLDTISVGAAVAFAMEAFENGVITEKECDGISLEWGNADAMLAMVHLIGKREGIGDILGQGVKRASEILGGNSGEYAIHVKGLEFPAHDPRAYFSTAIGYATSNRGACHLAGFSHGVENSLSVPEIGYSQTLDRFTNEGKGELVAKMQNLMGLFDSLKICKFILYGEFTLTDLLDIFNHITGFDMELDEFLTIGERIFNLKRLYNVSCGIRRRDDTLPKRVVTLKKDAGEAMGQLPDLETQLDEYYAYRRWDENGVPQEEKVRELGIAEFLQ